MPIEIVKINETTGDVILNPDACVLYKPIDILLRRDSTNGKRQFWRELGYAFIIGDYRSIPNQKGYNKKEAHAFAIKYLSLNDTFKVDSEVRDLIKFIAEEQVSNELEIYQALSRGLRSVKKILDKVNDEIDVILEKNECIANDKTLMFALLDKIIKLSNEIPSAIENIQAAEEAVRKSQIVGVKKKGGDVVLDSMNPS